MKKSFKILLLVAILVIVTVIFLLLIIFLPSNSVWDIAELIGKDDDFYIWIAAPQYSNFSIQGYPELSAEGKEVLNCLKLSCKAVDECTFADAENFLVLETTTGHAVQYFLFNEDFTMVWAVDNSWIEEDSEITQYEEICLAYRVKNPWTVKRFFEKVTGLDTTVYN